MKIGRKRGTCLGSETRLPSASQTQEVGKYERKEWKEGGREGGERERLK